MKPLYKINANLESVKGQLVCVYCFPYSQKKLQIKIENIVELPVIESDAAFKKNAGFKIYRFYSADYSGSIPSNKNNNCTVMDKLPYLMVTSNKLSFPFY
jgi:hypothetical protein